MTTTPADGQMLTVAEIATHCRVSKMTIYREIHGGNLHAFRVGRSFRVAFRDFSDYMRTADVDGE